MIAIRNAVALVAGLVLCALALPAEARRLALVIGNNDYKNVAPLQNARQDAKAIAETLQGLGFTVTLKQDLGLSAMKSTLREFKATVAGGDEVIFYFSGHGVQFEGTNYLVPTDIVAESEAQVVDDAVPLQRVLDDLHDQKARFALAIVDACRDNPFKGQGRAIGGRGLAPVTAANGQMVMYSAGAGQEALDRLGPNDRSPNGVFTRVLIKHMTQPGVPADRMLKDVAYEVVGLASSVHHEQVPALYDQTIGEFFFTPGTPGTRAGPDASIATAAPPPAPSVHVSSAAELEESYWARIKDSTDPQDFKDYGQQFPKGAHSAEAALLARKLAKQSAPAPATMQTTVASTSSPTGGGVAPSGSHPSYITGSTIPGGTLPGTFTVSPDGTFVYEAANGAALRGTLDLSNPAAVSGRGLATRPKKLGLIPERYPDGTTTTAVLLDGKVVNGVVQGQWKTKFDHGLFSFTLTGN